MQTCGEKGNPPVSRIALDLTWETLRPRNPSTLGNWHGCIHSPEGSQWDEQEKPASVRAPEEDWVDECGGRFSVPRRASQPSHADPQWLLRL